MEVSGFEGGGLCLRVSGLLAQTLNPQHRTLNPKRWLKGVQGLGSGNSWRTPGLLSGFAWSIFELGYVPSWRLCP